MTPQAIIALVMQILALAPTLVSAIAAVQKLEQLIANGQVPTQAEIDALLDSLNTNSDTIQELAAADETPVGEDPRPEPPPVDDEGSGP